MLSSQKCNFTNHGLFAHIYLYTGSHLYLWFGFYLNITICEF